MTPEQILDDMLAIYRPEVVEEVAALAIGRFGRERRAAALVVPHDPTTEAAVTGAAMVDHRCLDAALATGWSHDACYVPAVRRITLALIELYADGDPIDRRTCLRVVEHLDSRGRLLDTDPGVVTDMLAAACPHPPGVARDAEHLVELYQRRQAIAEAEAAAGWKAVA